MNILDNSAIRPCTSCQMCGAVCPKNAINIALNKDGFYRPEIDESLCIDCGLCVKVCNKFDVDVKKTTPGELEKTKLIASSAKDSNIVRQTTSGGIGDLLAKQLVLDGYKVVGVVYDSEKNIAIHEVAETEAGVEAFRGSKYIQSYSLDAFRDLVKGCRKQKYAVFGLPCQIYAVSRYLDSVKMRDNCILIDLYCHGCPSMHVWTKVSEDIRNKMNCRKFKSVIWRSKKRGWGTFVLEAEGDNERRFISRPRTNEFYDFFFSNQVLNESCTDCQLRGTLAYTDIRLGDFWGKEYDKTFRGMSGISLITERGKALFEKIIDHQAGEEKNYDTFLPYQSWSHVYKVDEKLRKQLLDLLSSESTSIEQCIEPLKRRRSLKSKLMIAVKHILSYLPNLRFVN